jgi:hypothetical protein
MIRLGHKYEAIHIRDGALSALHTEFPKDVDKWLEAGDDFYLIENYPGLLIDILNFAQELRLFSIVPAVYLAICNAYSLVCMLLLLHLCRDHVYSLWFWLV